MRILALAFCLFSASLGATGVFDPERLIAVVRRFQSTQGLLLIGAMRLAFGGALFLIAADTRHPQAVRWLGVFVFVAGLVTPLIGPDRFGRMLDWWATRGATALRVWSAVALGFALWVGYAVWPELRPD